MKKSVLLSIIDGVSFTAASAGAFLSVLSIIFTGHFISSSTAFMLLAFLFALGRMVLIRLSTSIPLLLELPSTLQRIERFLLMKEIPSTPLEYSQSLFRPEGCSALAPSMEFLPDDYQTVIKSGSSENQDGKTYFTLSVSGLTCKVNDLGEKFLLQDVSFAVSKNSLTVITGQVGCGKSTLLSTIAGEVVKTSGSIFCSGTVAYVPQSAWVFSGTIRENVLFGEPYNEEWYTKVLETCALLEDINRFPSGDCTFVGEHGVVLSGGQLARVNLARAVYADANVYLLDDPLSAVDIKVGEHIFEQCICTLLRNKIRVLVTHEKKHMVAADQVIVLDNGSVKEKGSFSELSEAAKILDTIKDTSFVAKEEKRSFEVRDERDTSRMRLRDLCGVPDKTLEISEEERATGKVSPALYWNYIQSGVTTLGVILLILLSVVTQGE